MLAPARDLLSDLLAHGDWLPGAFAVSDRNQANSGHPGTPMALTPLVDTIWNRVMRFDPSAVRSA